MNLPDKKRASTHARTDGLLYLIGRIATDVQKKTGEGERGETRQRTGVGVRIVGGNPLPPMPGARPARPLELHVRR